MTAKEFCERYKGCRIRLKNDIGVSSSLWGMTAIVQEAWKKLPHLVPVRLDNIPMETINPEDFRRRSFRPEYLELIEGNRPKVIPLPLPG